MEEDALVSKFPFDVHGFDCGYGGSLRPFALVNFLQESAGLNADALGIGTGHLQARGQTWMLSRLDLRVDRLPVTGDHVLVRTWPAGCQRLFALRALEMQDLSGKSLVRAVYAYLIVDLETRRPLRPERVFDTGMPCAKEALPIADLSFDLGQGEALKPLFSQTVSRRHIDHNGHANNAHLLNWLVDAAEQAQVEGKDASAEKLELSAMRVEFSAEALEGDRLEACISECQTQPFGPGLPASYVVLQRADAACARAVVALRKA